MTIEVKHGSFISLTLLSKLSRWQAADGVRFSHAIQIVKPLEKTISLQDAIVHLLNKLYLKLLKTPRYAKLEHHLKPLRAR